MGKIRPRRVTEQKEPESIDIKPSKTQAEFIISQVFENCLLGPRGEGKTDAGIMGMTWHATQQPVETRPVPWGVFRDTWTNLERTLLESFLNPRFDSFPAQIRSRLVIKDGGRVLELPGLWKAFLFGMNELADLNKLQSMQLGGLWLEEPAPAAVEDVGGGLDERVLLMGITSLRHPCKRRVQITSNYPDEDHWVWQRYGLTRHPKRQLFRIPSGENPAIDDEYRDNMREALKDDPGLLQRLVIGQPGFVVQGEKVTPEYDPDIHRADMELEPMPNVGGFRFWDGWLNPCCVIAQLTPRGHLFIYETVVGKNIGVRQLIRDYVTPLMKTKYQMIPEWTDIGDPTMATPDQSDVGQSAARVIMDELKTTFRGGVSKWDIRREGLRTTLTKKIDGRPFLMLSATDTVMHRALRGGWHYKKDAAGRIYTDKPLKDIHSHPGDALSYGVCHLLRMSDGGFYDLPSWKRQEAVTDWDVYA